MKNGTQAHPPATVLLADDHETNRKLLRAVLETEGYIVVEVHDGREALAALETTTTPLVALLDWEMPGIDGVEVCRQARLRPDSHPLYLILVAVRDGKRDKVAGLEAGANDYVTKPFERSELLARVKVGTRMVELQHSLASRVKELQSALDQVKQLSGILPICSYCKKIRDDGDYWQQVEQYVSHHSEARFSHSVCPACYDERVKPELDRLGIPGKTKPDRADPVKLSRH